MQAGGGEGVDGVSVLREIAVQRRHGPCGAWEVHGHAVGIQSRRATHCHGVFATVCVRRL